MHAKNLGMILIEKKFKSETSHKRFTNMRFLSNLPHQERLKFLIYLLRTRLPKDLKVKKLFTNTSQCGKTYS